MAKHRMPKAGASHSSSTVYGSSLENGAFVATGSTAAGNTIPTHTLVMIFLHV